MEKRNAGLARHRPRQKSLTGARKPHQKNAARNPRPDFQIFFGVFQKINDLLQFLFRLLQAGNVLESGAIPRGAKKADIGTPKSEGLRSAGFGLAENEPKHYANNNERQKRWD